MNSFFSRSNIQNAPRPRWALQSAGPAERSHGKKRKQQSYANGQADEPAGDVACPRAQRGVKPTQRENGKDRRNGFMKELAERAPEPPKTTLLRCRSSV